MASNVDSQGARLTGATVLACGASLNCSEFPPFSGRNVIYDDPSSGGTITVTFDTAITGMVHSVSARITGNTNITMTAYGKANAVLGTAQTGGPNYAGKGTPNMLLTIPSPTAAIARVVVHDSGNTFTIDDFTFSATPSVTLLDPGHGLLMGSDGKWHYQRPASPTYSLREDLLTLSIAAAAKDQLVNDDREVYMTRSEARALYDQSCGTIRADDTIDSCNDDLKLRIALAKRLKLDEKNDVTFVSVHTNGGLKRSIRGRTQTFYCLNESKLLADKLLAAIWAVAPANLSLSTGGYIDCDMAVLGKTAADKIPASLIEVLYHTDRNDEDLLINNSFLTNAGKGIASAIEEFIDEKAAAK